jgi:cytidylate kinase
VPIITITRGSLSATCRLANKLSERLGCRVVSREEVLEHGIKYGIRDTGLGEIGIMEKHPPYFWDRHVAQRRYYLAIFKAALMDLIIDGNAVYHGHVGQFLLSDTPKLLRVRADASMQFRINTLMQESSMTENNAEQYIKEIDIKRKKWAKFLYGIDFDDNQNYDLVLNMNRMSLDTMAGIIVCATDNQEFKQDKDSMKQMRDAHFRALIHAYLVNSPRTRGMELKAECDSDTGQVTISGMAPVYGLDILKNDIRDVLSKIDKVTNVEIKL